MQIFDSPQVWTDMHRERSVLDRRGWHWMQLPLTPLFSVINNYRPKYLSHRQVKHEQTCISEPTHRGQWAGLYLGYITVIRPKYTFLGLRRATEICYLTPFYRISYPVTEKQWFILHSVHELSCNGSFGIVWPNITKAALLPLLIQFTHMR